MTSLTKLLFAYNKNIYECVVLIARSTFPPFVCKKNFPPTKLLFAYNKNIYECVVLITRSTFVSKDHIWGRPLIHMRSKHHNVARLMCFCAISCAKCSFDRNFCGSLDLISVLWLKRTVNDNTSNHSIDISMVLVGLVLSFGRSCLVLSCLVLSCLVLSCLVLSCLVWSCLVLSSLLFSCFALSSLVWSSLV